MRKEIGAIVVGCSANALCLFLGFVLMAIPIWLAWIGVGISTIILLYGLYLFFSSSGAKKSGAELIRKITPNRPSRNKLAYQISIDIQEFQKLLYSTISGDAIVSMSNCNLAKGKLDNIVNNKLPKINTIFKENHLIREKVLLVNGLFEQYRVSILSLTNRSMIGIYTDADIKKQIWGRGVEDKNSIIGQITANIREVLDLLSKEGTKK